MTDIKKVVFVSGAAGSIGSALVYVLCKKGYEVIGFDNNETGIFDLEENVKGVKTIIGSIRDENLVNSLFKRYKPEIVFHCAAYKHVVQMERWPLEAMKTNIGGTINMMEAAISSKVKKFVFISSDKAVNPLSIMGLSKYYGERLAKIFNSFSKTKFIVVRFGNVMPSRGSVVPIFQKQITEGKNLTITSKKMQRFFMGIYEAVELVLKAAQLGKGGEIFVLDMGSPIVVEDLAKLMIKLSGKPLKISYTKPAKGEKFFEDIMTGAEEKVAVRKGKLWIIKK